jgi:hypothetical protein
VTAGEGGRSLIKERVGEERKLREGKRERKNVGNVPF